MKRTGFKQKLPSQKEHTGELTVVYYPKREKKRKKNRSPDNLSKLKKELWELCKQITRARYKNCYTCTAQNLTGRNAQTGHGKPKGALPLRFQYDLRNLKLQCLHDNLDLGGCSDIFISKLEQEKEGLEFLQESCRKIDGVWIIQKNDLMSGTEAKIFVKEKIEEYKKILENTCRVIPNRGPKIY